MRPKQNGDITEAAILSCLLASGWNVSIPFGDNQRYDLIIEKEGSFHRVQCKTARLSQEGRAITFNVCSTSPYLKGGRRGYQGQVEFFGVHCPAIRKSYLIPIGEVKAETAMILRLEPTLSGQKSLCQYASSYEIQLPIEQDGTASTS